ncbi:hypothetical protein VXE65_32725 [Mycolicibacterium conceptionense]|uniref:hypothetical protein n=1 Tax=Mycolicibacterium conceptionense TaxID=451644 RepID=UPI003204A39E
MKIMLLVAAGVAVGLTAALAVLIQLLAQLLPFVIVAVVVVIALRLARHVAARVPASGVDRRIPQVSADAPTPGAANIDHAASYLSWGPAEDDDWATTTPAGAAWSRRP